MKRFFLTLCALCATTALWADTETVNEITWAYSVSNGEASIESGDSWTSAIPESTSGSITIPSILGGYPVTSIGGYEFYWCSGLTSVTIPEGVTSIGDGAFYVCSGLTSVTIPSSVTSIGNDAFAYCSSLTSVTIPEGVTLIGNSLFFKCSGLTSVTIPDSVTSIGEAAFDGCSSLTSITIPEGVTSIGDFAFSGCSGLTSITIPDSVTSIGDFVFYGCTELTSITIPEGVTSIGVYAFYNCSSLRSITIPDSVTSIGDYAFYNCLSLTSVTIPDSVTSIGEAAFDYCSFLTSVTFLGPPPSVKTGDSLPFPSTNGYYLEKYASEWEAVIADGKWQNLTMLCTDPPSFTVTLTAVGDGSVSGGGEQTWDEPVTVTAIADEGWVFCGWSTTPVVMTPEYTFTMPMEDVDLTAYFVPKQAVDQVIQQHVTDNNLKSEAEVAEAIQQHVTDNNLKSEAEVAEAIQQHIAENDLISRDEVKEMAFDTPLVEVGAETIEISISLQTAETLNAWNPMLLQGATLDVDQEAGKVRVIIPKGDKKAAFYKFIVPTDQSK